MLYNIVDNRKRKYRWRKVTAIIEPTCHDNCIRDRGSSRDPEADQTTQVESSYAGIGYDEKGEVSLHQAILWAEGFSFPVTLFLYDLGEGISCKTESKMSDELTSKPQSREHQEGYCAGFMDAMKMIERNRAHYRRLLGRPEMTQDEVLQWIYSRPWKDSGTHRTAPRRLSHPHGEPEVGPPAIESIDLYLIPGISGCSVDENGRINFEMSGYKQKQNSPTTVRPPG